MSSPEPARVLAALGDPTRLELVRRLADGDARSIRRLGDGLDLSRQAVTKHLKVLERAGVVVARRVGREQHFELDPEPMREVRDLLDAVSARWDAALERLRAQVED